MRTIVGLLVALIALGPVDLWASQKNVPTDVEQAALKQMASKMPLGARIKAQTLSGAKINGTLMGVTDEAVLIKKNTRVPEPAVTVPYSDLGRLELQGNEGMNAAKIVGIGLAAGAGAILTLFAFFAALDD